MLARFVLEDVLCDVDADGVCDVSDLDAFYDSGDLLNGYAASEKEMFDLSGDGIVDVVDRDEWLVVAAKTNGVAGYYAGDTDLDGEVGFADFLTLSGSFGSPGRWSNGDFDANGEVEFADFLVLSNNFGKSGTAAASVPEPSSAFLALICVVAFAIRGRKRV